MKINIKGETPMERLVNLTRGVLAVPKEDIERADRKRPQKKKRAKSRLLA